MKELSNELYKKYIILFYILLALSSISQASGYEGKIIKVLAGPQYGAKVFLTVDGDPGQSGCHTNINFNYVFDGSTESGKITLSLALAAYADQKLVRADGDSSCTIYDGVENLRQLLSK